MRNSRLPGVTAPRQALALTALACAVALVVFMLPFVVLTHSEVSAGSDGDYPRPAAGPKDSGSDSTCASCHEDEGDFTPSLTVEGSLDVHVGQTNDFSLVLSDSSGESPEQAGFCLEIAAGQLGSDDDGVRVRGEAGESELSDDGHRDFEDDEVVWDFTWEAPATAGTYDMYLAAVAGNGNGSETGDNLVYVTISFTVIEPNFLRGDVDGNGVVQTLIDPIFSLKWAFQGGDAPPCLAAADTDGNGEVHSLLDPIYALNWGFNGGDAPPEPGVEECGPESEDEDIVGCETEPECGQD